VQLQTQQQQQQQQQEEGQPPAAAEVQQLVKAALQHMTQTQHQARMGRHTRLWHLVAQQVQLLHQVPPPLLLLLLLAVLLLLRHLLRRVCCGWTPLMVRLSCPPAPCAWSGWMSTSVASLQRCEDALLCCVTLWDMECAAAS
jgi:hypothetical protein